MTPKNAIFYLSREHICNEIARQEAIKALEKQTPKKPYKEKGRLQNNYFCSVCKYYLGDEKELEYAGLQPEYCQQCGQALDWNE